MRRRTLRAGAASLAMAGSMLLAPMASPSEAQASCEDEEVVTIGDDPDSLEACIGGGGEDEGGSGNPVHPYHWKVTTEGEPPCWRVTAVPFGSPGYDDASGSWEDVHAVGETIYGVLLPLMEQFAETISNASGGIISIDFGFPDMILECESVDPEVQAYLAWRDTIILPPPAGELDPGDEVVTGMDTYLQIGDYGPDWDTDTDPRTVTWTGPITIVATAEHRVDWGDGTTTPEAGWYATNGRAWSENPPEGGAEPITHVYQDATDGDDRTTITVTTRWTARWSVPGGGGGVVPFFRYSESTVDLDVDEVQPVIIDQS